MKLSEIKEFIKSLGGNATVAKHCGVSPTAVSLWVKRQSIPASRMLSIFDLVIDDFTVTDLLKKFTKSYVSNENLTKNNKM